MASGTTPTIAKPYFWYDAQHNPSDEIVSPIQYDVQYNDTGSMLPQDHYTGQHMRPVRIVTLSDDVPIIARPVVSSVAGTV